MSLHYLVNLDLEVSSNTCYHWLLQEETPEFIPPQLWPLTLTDLNPFDYNMWEYCKKRSTKYTSLNELKQRLTTEWAKIVSNYSII